MTGKGMLNSRLLARTCESRCIITPLGEPANCTANRLRREQWQNLASRTASLPARIGYCERLRCKVGSIYTIYIYIYIYILYYYNYV